VEIFRRAKFSPAKCNNMNAWQKTHIAVVMPIGKALYRYDSDNYQLARSYETVKQMILANRECFQVLKDRNIKITPGKLNFFYLPIFLLVPVFMIILNTKFAEFAMAKHTIAAKEEMGELESVFRIFIKESSVKTPSLNWLTEKVNT
jgi:2-dehydropantoate 2-reductase